MMAKLSKHTECDKIGEKRENNAHGEELDFCAPRMHNQCAQGFQHYSLYSENAIFTGYDMWGIKYCQKIGYYCLQVELRDCA